MFSISFLFFGTMMNDITHLIMCNVDSLENETLSSDYIIL